MKIIFFKTNMQINIPIQATCILRKFPMHISIPHQHTHQLRSGNSVWRLVSICCGMTFRQYLAGYRQYCSAVLSTESIFFSFQNFFWLFLLQTTFICEKFEKFQHFLGPKHRAPNNIESIKQIFCNDENGINWLEIW